MRHTVTISIIGLVFGLFSCRKGPDSVSGAQPATYGQIRGPGKDIFVVGRTVQVRGRWRQIEGRDRYSLAALNAVEMICDKEEGTCEEAIAELLSPLDMNAVSPPQLYARFPEKYQVLSWSEDTILAHNATQISDTELRISVRDKLAEKSYHLTKARGNGQVDPNFRYSYVLE